MSELIQKNDSYNSLRWNLLTGVSALALVSYIALAGTAQAEEGDRPQLWIELGGGWNKLTAGSEIISPAFLEHSPPDFFSPEGYEKPLSHGFEESAALTFQPKGSDWIVSASVHYGRSTSLRHAHQQTYPGAYAKYSAGGGTQPVRPNAARFIDVESAHSERHAIIDFQAGKDVGVGLFGSGSSSVLNVGVRIAQFYAKSRSTLREDPDWRFEHKYVTYPPYAYHLRVPIGQPFHSYYNDVRVSGSFNGIGPSVSWKSSSQLAGNEDAKLTVDWGVNAALLFGRQKVKTHQQTINRYHEANKYGFYTSPPTKVTIYNHPDTPDHIRARSVTIPNIGGFVGLSAKYPNAKFSVGYRADFFFGAMDVGVASRRTTDVGFHGPFATVSIGLGG